MENTKQTIQTETDHIYIIEIGDMGTGIQESIYKIETPFNIEDIDSEDLEDFKNTILKLYNDFSETRCFGMYDFEYKNLEP